jgi:hypothetical protein
LAEELEEIQQSRKSRTTEIDEPVTDGFVDIDQNHHVMVWNQLRGVARDFAFKAMPNATFLDIFLKIVTVDLLKAIIDQSGCNSLMISITRGWSIRLTIQSIYIALALSIAIIGEQNRPLLNRKHKKPLREAIIDAQNRLLALHPEVPMIGINALEKIVSLPIFTSPFTEIISTNFQDLVFRIGEYCSGDEKLFRFTGSSGDSRLVPNKPGRIGLWFYQLCAPLRYGNAYLLWCKLHHSNPFLGETVPVSSIVESWAKVVKKLGTNGRTLTLIT